jgi:hypothetical protein
MNDTLNSQQRSSLRSTLQSFERNLRTARSWLDGAREDGILYNARVQISEARRRQVNREITQALDQIGSLSR